MYPGVRINPSDATADFFVAFDPRGARADVDTSFSPLVVVNQVGQGKSVSISTVGNIRIE
jgi:hypothetical protein